MLLDMMSYGGDAVGCDVCVVGAGPAGIVLARELGAHGLDVVLLESGGMKFDPQSHDLNRGEVLSPASHGPLEAYRRRGFGGASTSWGGRCAPFDAVDFEARDYVPHSGWPIGKRDLDPFYERANATCDVGPYAYRVAEALSPEGRARPFIPGLESEDVASDGLYLFSPPVNFGARFGGDLASSPRVRVFLHAECMRLVLDRDGNSVRAVEARSIDGRRLLVTARRFVLAAGGLEVTRLLLRSNDVHRGGIGNHAGLLGRFYMCHVLHRFEIEVRSPDIVWDYEKTSHGAYCQRTIGVRPDRQRALRLLNHRARIEHPDITDPSHRSGVLSAAYLVKAILSARGAEDIACRAGAWSRGVLHGDRKGVRRVWDHVGNIGRDGAFVARFAKRWITSRVLGERQLPSIVMKSRDGVYTLRLDAEQAPNPESRVKLGASVDAFGQRRLEVDWRVTDLDGHSATRACEVIGEALARSGAGRLHTLPGFVPEATGGHHMGTTRMSSAPSGGVVDPACRVHGVPNLYVASPSVFPTSSYANPMLTLVALTLRLADHLTLGREAPEIGRRAVVEAR